jgi:hypothetical protein
MDIASLKSQKGKPTVTFPHWSIIVIDEEISLFGMKFTQLPSQHSNQIR